MGLTEEISIRGKRAIEYLINICQSQINPEEPLQQAAIHYLRGGGKGFRPAMLQLVCAALGGNEEIAIAPAAAIESLHVSSLLHDDWMDKDETRRGMTAVWKQWDPTIAILAGDVLFGVAFAIVGEVKEISFELRYGFTKELAEKYTQLCEGQMYDIGFENMDFRELSLDDVTKMQYLKTGVLFEFACVTGARIALSKMRDPLIDIVAEYAKLAGTAFQIQDDLIGILGDTSETGKPVGSDIKSGKKTIIAMHAFENANDQQRVVLESILGNGDSTDQKLAECLNVMKEIGSIDYAVQLANEMATKAIELTSQLPMNEYTDLLAEFAKFMVERSF